MKKMILFLLIFTHIGVYAQEQTDTKKIEKIEDTTIRYNPHSLGMSFRFGGLANNRVGGTYEHVGVYTTVFEFYTQERKGKSKYTPLVGIRISSPLGGVNPYIYGGLRWGFLFGGSQYVFDLRSKETGLGWSMLVNGGLTAEITSIKEILQISRHPFIIGGELEFKAIYNVHKYTGITFGLHMGYVASVDASTMLEGMLGVSEDEGSLNIDHGFTWAFSIGMIF